MSTQTAKSATVNAMSTPNSHDRPRGTKRTPPSPNALHLEQIALVQQRMGELGLTNEKLGLTLGVTGSTVSKWLSGDRGPRQRNLYALVQALDVPLVQLTDLRGYAATLERLLAERTAEGPRVDAQLRESEEVLSQALGAVLTAYEALVKTMTTDEIDDVLDPAPALDALHDAVLQLLRPASRWRKLRAHPSRWRTREALPAPDADDSPSA